MISGMKSAKTKIAFIGSYPPRRCGIATFTSDLVNNLYSAAAGHFEPAILAMESDSPLTYVDPVRKVIRKNVQSEYIEAAHIVNRSDIDLVNLQYEFGLFDGPSGSFLPSLLGRITKPLVTTLHTVLEEPWPVYFNDMIEVCSASEAIVVMNERGVDMLQQVYGVPGEKIELIGHGIPDMLFADTALAKEKLGLAGRKTILTFGLLSANKGIEVMLRAMPDIIAADPSVIYIVLGETHPEVMRCDGPVYINRLESIVRSLGLENHVVLDHRFVKEEDLFQYLKAADVYVTPYLNRQQLTSGTLAIAVGSGRAVVSTPYWAAQEFLANGRGKLVDFHDHQQTAEAINELLENPRLAMAMRLKAYRYGRSITWSRIAKVYWRLFRQIRQIELPAIKEQADLQSQVV